MFRFAVILSGFFIFFSFATAWAKVKVDAPVSVSTVTDEDIETDNTVYVYASRLPTLKIAQNIPIEKMSFTAIVVNKYIVLNVY